MSLGTKWTYEQQRAIDERNKNILVSAAAGSGKTAVLVERIIGLITNKANPINIDNLLVLTFTKAAAMEMRERIGKRILDLSYENPSDLNLKNQLMLLNKAQITTIHSFCMDVVRKNYSLLGLDPKFRICDEAEAALLEAEVLEALFEKKYEALDKNFIDLVESFEGRLSDLSLKQIIINLYKFMQSNPFPKAWADSMLEKYNLPDNTPFEETYWGGVLKEEIYFRLNWAESITKAALKVCNLNLGPKEYLNSIVSDLDIINSLKSSLEISIEDFYTLLNDTKFSPIGRKKKDTMEVMLSIVKELREDSKRVILETGTRLLFKNTSLIISDILALKPFISALTSLVFEYKAMFMEAKAKKHLVDFSDLEHFCVKALIKEKNGDEIIISDYAKSLRNRYKEILTDEYQDSNIVQELILNAVSSGNNRFMVGDVKQSIYKFRLARPEIFMEKYNSYGEDKSGESIRIDLDKNFRSRKYILDGINYIFKELMSNKLGDVDYNDVESLKAGGVFPPLPDEKIYVDIIDAKDIKSRAGDEIDEELTGNIIEAYHIAGRIKKLMEEKISITLKDGSLRPIRLSDIVILMRSPSSITDIYKNAFDNYGIPLYTDTSTGFFDTTEIMTITSYLSIIDNPIQDIPIITVLFSPIYGLSVSDLTEIRLIDDKLPFYQCIRQYISENKNELSKALQDFINDLNFLRGESKYLSISELILKVYSLTGYLDIADTMVGGGIRVSNLRLLVEKAEAFEQSNFQGLFNFIKYIERIKDTTVQMGEAKTIGENDDVVRLMTIHKSKGLEFPVVFVSGLGRKFNKDDATKPVILHQDMGFGLNRYDYKNRVVYNTVSRVLMGNKTVREGLSEEVRILYVALTRARDRLYLTGTVNNLSKKLLSWCIELFSDNPSYYSLLDRSNYLDWIMSALIKHRDCIGLRELCDMEIFNNISNDTSKWEIKIINGGDFKFINDDKEVITSNMEVDLNALPKDSGFREEILRRFNYIYPYTSSVNMPSNISISEIKRLYQDKYTEDNENRLIPFNEDDFPYPDFKGQKGIDYSKIGSGIHSIMENIDFKMPLTLDYFKEVLDRLIKNGVIEKSVGKKINLKIFDSLIKDPMLERIKNADSIHKEEAFAIGILSNEIIEKPNEKPCETILLHGIIDLYLVEDSKIILIDYKSDYIRSGDEGILIDRYKVQMDTYKKALEISKGLEVKETYIYSFSLGKFIRI